MDRNEEILQNLIKRVYHLEQEVIRLGGQPYKKEEKQSVKEVAQDTEAFSAVTEQPVLNVISTSEEAPAVNTVKASDETPAAKTANANIAKQTAKKSAPKKKENVENKIGKNGMAILASILIFFSLILFAGIAFSYLSNIAKVVIMYAISIAIAVFGVVKMTKINTEKDAKFKTFYTTLAACGIGAVYITDLVAYFGFKCLPLVVFIVFLVIWILVTMCLAYKFSPIFAYISNIGLIIATVLTAVQFNSSIVAFILYTICLAALYLIGRTKNFNRDSYFFIQYPLVFIVLSVAVETGALSYTIFAVLLLSVLVFANIAYKPDKKYIITNSIAVILNICALVRMCSGVDGNIMKYVTILLLIGIMAMYYVRFYSDIRVLFYIVYAVTYFVSIFLFLTTDMYITVAFIPFILFLVLGFVKKDIWIRAGGYLALVSSYMIQMNFYESWIVFAFYFLILVAVALVVRFMLYSMVDKYVVTAAMCLVLSYIIDIFKIDICISFAIFGILAFITNTELYRKNIETGAEEISSKIIGYVFAVVMIYTGITSSFSKSITPELYQVIVIMLITLVLSCMNTVKLFKLGLPELLVGFYICIKFSLWIYTVLHRLEAASYVISIVGILVAIVCIVLGFRLRQKSFRLYGLIISMVSVIKLILFDISYDSNILRPVGFFVAGVLCFAISFIYSKLEKSISLEEES